MKCGCKSKKCCPSVWIVLLVLGLLALASWYGFTRTVGAEEPVAVPAVTAEDEFPGLKNLSEENRRLVLEQKICPVMRTELGRTGEPIKVTANGVELFVCCGGCVRAIERDPEKYLKRLAELKEKK